MWWNGGSWNTLIRVTFGESRAWASDDVTWRRKQNMQTHKLGNGMARGQMSAFQRRQWEQVVEIKFGKVRSFQERVLLRTLECVCRFLIQTYGLLGYSNLDSCHSSRRQNRKRRE